jgi:putative DNA primase/helicase
LIPFTVVIPDDEQDHRLLERLATETPGILSWAVRGCCAWQERGLGMPEEVRDATAAYRRDMDLLADFLGDRCVVDPMASVAAADLYPAYVDWAEEVGEKAMSQKALGGYLRERGFEPVRTETARGWVGVRLRGPMEPTP